MSNNRFAVLDVESVYETDLQALVMDAASSSDDMSVEDSPATSNFTDEAAHHLAVHDDEKRGINSVNGSHAENAYRTYRINWTWTMPDSRMGIAFPSSSELAAATMSAGERVYATHAFGEFNQQVKDPRVRTSVPRAPLPIEDIPARIPTPQRGSTPLRKHASVWKWSSYSSKDFENGTSRSARKRRARRIERTADFEAQTRSDFRLKFKEKIAHRIFWYDTFLFLKFRNIPMFSTFTPRWASRHYTALDIEKVFACNAGNIGGIDYCFYLRQGGLVWIRDDLVDIIPGMQDAVDAFWDAVFCLRSDLAERLLRWRPGRYTSDWWSERLFDWAHVTDYTSHIYRIENGRIRNYRGGKIGNWA